MLSAIVDGKVLDYKYKKIQENHYVFNIGDICIGEIFKMRSGWGVVVTYKPSISVGVVYGFKTRTNAAQYMIQCTELLKN